MNETDPVVELITTFVAGPRHHTSPDVLAKLAHGTRLTMAREPANPADRNAVRFTWPDHPFATRDVKSIGYVPAVQAGMVARLLDAGFPLTAVVVVLVEPAKYEVVVELRLPRWPAQKAR